ncbi:SDR family oxidoreductase [Rhizobium halophytocola]|uniref:NAD(P)-dependent dehydrogenase (Short-subunit alcohol dehydrogenase family) n=1 Tax=Rhizobium halophytocola TaxID=735519 RepID=A0ABS4E5Y2_9HYPH|nr:SDR family oxidoreductase [Rhizobium halophytocola]MBP1853309.1 NAD(P)-dependent dehydrogenase (short-subunit alcohol dehydrogenase family) [Rhizobium halophytocola]
MRFQSRRILVIGGGSGMGLALAARLLDEGAEVIIAGRSAERLDAARRTLGAPGRLTAHVADATSAASLTALFAATGPLDHIATTAADIAGVYVPLAEMDVDVARRVMDSKVLGPLLIARHGRDVLTPTGSITLTSGIAAYRPAPRGTVVAAVNGALESLVYALALELAPMRVNVVSPGWVETGIWAHVAGDRKAQVLGAMAERLPVGRVGRPEDIAAAMAALMENGFITGTLLHVDGGQRLV